MKNEQQPAYSQQQTDEELARVLQSVSLPAVPANLELATRRRIRQRVIQQVVLRSVATAACVWMLLGAFQFFKTPSNNLQPPQTAYPQHKSVAIPLGDTELALMFAPPPVDPLALLDRQQQVAVQTLKQWDRSR